MSGFFDIWSLAKRFTPLGLSLACIALAVSLAVGLSHIAFILVANHIPEGLTTVAASVTLVIAVPMVHVFVQTMFQLDASNSRLLNTKTRLNFQKEEAAKARNELSTLNADLEIEVAKRTHDLQLALHKAESANVAKSVFLANMSHELRTPLNGIIGYADMIINREHIFGNITPEKLDDYATAIMTSGKRLHAMVSDLLDLSKIEFDQFDYIRSPVGLRSLIEEAVRELTPLANSRRQTIEVTAPDAGIGILTDRRAAHQVLSNLISNALKYSGDGQIIKVDVDCGEAATSIRVTDNGIGMSEEALSKASRPFSKFSDAHIAAGQSVGLGLSIAVKLCELIGGKLNLSSVEGKGTVARIELPGRAEELTPTVPLAQAG